MTVLNELIMFAVYAKMSLTTEKINDLTKNPQNLILLCELTLCYKFDLNRYPLYVFSILKSCSYIITIIFVIHIVLSINSLPWKYTKICSPLPL